jgi:hypothetical protein
MRTSLFSPWIVSAAVLAGGTALSGCADFARATADLRPAAVNVESPVAPAVLAAQTAPVAYPRFADIPLAPPAADNRTAFEWRRTVQTLSRDGGDVTAWAQANPVIAPDTTAAFNAGALKELKFSLSDAPPEDQPTRTDAWAQGQRGEAAAPAPPK